MRTVCMELGDRVEGQWEEKLWVMVNTSLDGEGDGDWSMKIVSPLMSRVPIECPTLYL